MMKRNGCKTLSLAGAAMLMANLVITAANAQTQEPVAALSAELSAQMESAEKHGHASFFPRKNILALVTKSMWRILYHSDASTAVQMDALSRLKTRVSTPIQKEAVERMQVELELN
jgi:hypothetical protein